MKYPKKLKIGDTIGITAPSSGANIEKADKAIINLKNMGFNILETSNVRKTVGLVSSKAEERAEEFMELFENNKVSHIISARGGEFLMEILPYLEKYEERIKKSVPKWVQGFSDNSLLLFYLTTKYNIATIHAENLGDFSMEQLDESITNNVKFLTSNESSFYQRSFKKYQLVELESGMNSYNLTEEVKYKKMGKKEDVCFSGRIIGGCIDVITILLGTKYDFVSKFCNQFNEGIIWYIDNCELSYLEFYRRLWHMKESGWFKNVKGFLIGRSLVEDNNPNFSFKDAIKNALSDFNVPIIYDVDIGHVPPQLTIINGSYATVEYSSKEESAKIIQKLI